MCFTAIKFSSFSSQSSFPGYTPSFIFFKSSRDFSSITAKASGLVTPPNNGGSSL